MLPSSFKAAIWRGQIDNEVVFGVEGIEPITPLDPHYVAIRVTAANISISDHLFLRPENQGGPAPLPQVLGHGGVGVVDTVGAAVNRVKPGDRVIMYGTPQCNDCWYCLNGRPDWCAELQFAGPAIARTSDGLGVHASSAVGAFAEYAIVPQNQLVPVSSALPDDQLAFLSISGSSGIGPALLVAPVRPGSTAAIVGLGPCGLSALQAARLAGASTVIAIDPIESRRELALSLGADHVIDAGSGDPVAQLQKLCPDRGGMFGKGADFVFEATTTTEGMQQAWNMAPACGTVVLSSVPRNMGAEVVFAATPFACQGKTVHGSQQGGFGILRDTPWAIDLLESGKLNFAPILRDEYALADVVQALDDVSAHNVIGATLYPAGASLPPAPTGRRRRHER
jgi:S-(hydroxymethyl)glutathione dehydrogenase / alcohol dehydrogenase